MTPQQYKREYLGDFRVDERQISLDKRLAQYYRDTPSEMGNKQALFHWKLFSNWAYRNGYSREEVNAAKRRVNPDNLPPEDKDNDNTN